SLPGIELPEREQPVRRAKRSKSHSDSPERTSTGPDADAIDAKSSSGVPDDLENEMTGLLIRALWLSQEKDDSGWMHSSAVKQQMRRMDPSFNEKALGFRSFSDFLKSRS